MPCALPLTSVTTSERFTSYRYHFYVIVNCVSEKYTQYWITKLCRC